MKKQIEDILLKSKNRYELWNSFITEFNCFKLAEVGVYKGDFAANILKESKQITKYFMIDPWRNLSDWNKPANADDITFNEFYNETLKKTEFAESKREILRGKTVEVIEKIVDESLDFAYIDGDHTLKGIAIDLISIWPKIHSSGFIAGDDFSSTIWQHSQEYEPTLVFPFAVYFAEAMNVKIFALPYNQFVICKGVKGFEFIDLTNGAYQNTELRNQFITYKRPTLKQWIKRKVPMVYTLYKKFKY